MLLTDVNGRADIMYCASAKTKRIFHSVLGAETLSLLVTTNMAIIIIKYINDVTENDGTSLIDDQLNTLQFHGQFNYNFGTATHDRQCCGQIILKMTRIVVNFMDSSQ